MMNVYPGPKGAAGHVLPHPSACLQFERLLSGKMESSIYSSLTFMTAGSHLHFMFFLTL